MLTVGHDILTTIINYDFRKTTEARKGYQENLLLLLKSLMFIQALCTRL